MFDDIFGNSFLNNLDVGGKRLKHVISNPHHELNSKVAKSFHCFIIGIVKLHLLNYVVHEQHYGL
jgi:hypothetical protein